MRTAGMFTVHTERVAGSLVVPTVSRVTEERGGHRAVCSSAPVPLPGGGHAITSIS